MSTDVEICNQALDHLNTKAVIQSLDEKSKEAEACKRHYAQTVEELLRDHDWGFSSSYVRLARLENAPQTGGWLFTYRYPTKCLRIWELLPDMDATGLAQHQTRITQEVGYQGKLPVYKFKLGRVDGSRVVYCNIDTAWARYAAPVEEPAQFDAQFVGALSYALAAKMAMTLTGRLNIMQRMEEMRDRVLLEAQGGDANEGTDDMNDEADWIRARA